MAKQELRESMTQEEGTEVLGKAVTCGGGRRAALQRTSILSQPGERDPVF